MAYECSDFINMLKPNIQDNGAIGTEYPVKCICSNSNLNLFYGITSKTLFESGGKLITSNDGVTWHKEQSDVSEWVSICYSGELGIFCAIVRIADSYRIIIKEHYHVYGYHEDRKWRLPYHLPSNNTWESICWSPELGLFCAVASTGNSNQIMTSSDGTYWKTQCSPLNNEWQSICWSPELMLFCAISSTGNGNQIMTSPNGIYWTTHCSPVINEWSSICWSPKLMVFCAVSSTGNNNQIMTSSDGTYWTTLYNPSNAEWIYIKWHKYNFYAIARSGEIMSSYDCNVWQMENENKEYNDKYNEEVMRILTTCKYFIPDLGKIIGKYIN